MYVIIIVYTMTPNPVLDSNLQEPSSLLAACGGPLTISSLIAVWGKWAWPRDRQPSAQKSIV